MPDVVILDAVRSPIGKRNGGLSSLHPADLLGQVQSAVTQRSGFDPSSIDQVVGGCVSQVGEQSSNIIRTAWLSAGLPLSVPASTVDTQCGSSHQAFNLASGLVGSGSSDIAMACGVEIMSRIPIGAATRGDLGRPTPGSYHSYYELTTQFDGAERIAQRWSITRDDTDAYGLRSQELAAGAWAEDRFAQQVVEIEAPVWDEATQVTGHTLVSRDEGLRDTTLDGLAKLRPVASEDGIHTAGTSSQISDGASAVILATAERARELGARPRARVVATCLVGVDPVLMLTGPIDATRALLDRSGLSVDDIDVFEINEAFASVVLAWAKELEIDLKAVNPNGGAIAMGHPLGGTGTVLITKALHELERTGGRYALIAMCCGGGIGTGTIIERV